MIMPEPDEHIVPWLEMLAGANFMPRKEFAIRFLGKNGQYRLGDSTLLELDRICNSSDLFPDAVDILERHTAYGTMMPFRSKKKNILIAEQILRPEQDLHLIPPYKSSHWTPLMYCPRCMEEDLEKRPYVRTWHALPGVTACAVHGCKLRKYTGDDGYAAVVPADESEIRYASFLYQVYQHQPRVVMEDISDLLDGTEVGRLMREAPRTVLSLQKIIRAFCDRYSAEEFVELAGERQKDGRRITRKECVVCGHRYHTFASAEKYGYGCPACEKGKLKTDLLQKRLDLSWNKEYEVIGFEDEETFKVRHKSCGREYVLPLNLHTLSKKRQLCDTCDYKYRDRIGETAAMNCGETCMITDYRSSLDIDVRFTDGAVITGASYSAFVKRELTHPSRMFCVQAEQRLGEKGKTNSGLVIKIVGYRSAMDLDVQFEDGAVSEHISYTDFRNGTIAHPEMKPEVQAVQRLGEKRRMNCGMEAEIIRYGAYADIDVRFSDGVVVKNTAYKEFSHGTILHPALNAKGLAEKRLGEKRKMNCGLEAEIIAYRSYTDMDIRFEDGTVAEHIEYGNFQKGRATRPVDSRRNKGKFRIGERRMMNCGLEAKIIAYRRSEDMDVQFTDGIVVEHVQYTNFKRGMVGHP